jgi:UDP-N-acetylmuramoyl-tripeptide--D-alanyl-D-alanine ligase
VTALETEMQIEAEDLLAIGARGEGGGPFSGVSIDSRTLKPGELFVAIRGPRADGHAFLGAAAAAGATGALVDRDAPAPPGLPLYRVPDATLALAALARARRERLGTKVLGITGSTGKTTTKDMAAELLLSLGPVLKTEGNLNNQYGLPLTLLRLEPDHRAAVLELGMSAAGEIRALSAIARPDVAVITNVAPAHLAFFPSVDAIADAKAEILEGLGSRGVAVLNGDDPRVAARAGRHSGRVLLFGKDRSFYASFENWRGTVFGMRFTLRLDGRPLDVALPLGGPHFVQNFLAAAAAASALGVSGDAIVEGALRLRPAAHRGEVLRLEGGVVLLDDAYNASPLAVAAAVATLALAPGTRRVAFLGDMLELGERGPELHRETGAEIARKIDVLAGVGPLSQGFLDGASRAGLPKEALHAFPDSESAALAVRDLVRPGDAVLVKGSRGMRMERVTEAVLRHFPRTADVP